MTLATDGDLVAPSVNIFRFEMQLRLFRHFVPVSVVLLASSDALLITGAFYQLISSSEVSTPIVLGVCGGAGRLDRFREE